MSSRGLARWQQAAAVAPVLLLLVYLPGEMMLRCRMDGLLRSACCCQHDQDRDAGPVVKAQDCCDRELTENQPPTGEAARPASRDLGAIVVVTAAAAPVSLPTSPTARLDRTWHRGGPAREGPPIILLKHAFLI